MPKNQQNLVRRSPVVVVMGHIDHGKSTLLDYIRKTKVAAGEAGGITQHVGAYEAEYAATDGKKHTITFLDTPGHEAFCSIRERGARAADIAILVVSAEDGVKPQTLEALKEIKAAKIPYIVALNKIDKTNANIDKTKTGLGENEIYVEGWGGEIPCVSISALDGTGVPELLDMVSLVAEMADLSTDPGKQAEGVVVEAELDTRRGVSATLLIKNGTLDTGSFVIAGDAYAPVRYIEDFKGDKIERAAASMPVVVVGWNKLPECGAAFKIVKTKKEAEQSAGKIIDANRAERAPDKKEEKKDEKDEPKIVSMPIIIKADATGSLEGVKHELAKIRHDRVRLKIVSEGIGEINENDVKSVQGDPSILIIGFNEEPDRKAAAMIERSPVPLQVKTFSIIYELAEFVAAVLLAKVPKEYVEEMIGRAKISTLFSKDKDRQIVGGKVQEGMLETGAAVRIMRREAEIGRGVIRELQQQKKRVGEVREGYEFGMLVESKIELFPGDKLEAVKTVEKR